MSGIPICHDLRIVTRSSSVQSIIVDSKPIHELHPSNTGTLSPKYSSTIDALVALGCQDGLVLGQTTGWSRSSSNCRVSGWLGIRQITLANHLVAWCNDSSLHNNRYDTGPGLKWDTNKSQYAGILVVYCLIWLGHAKWQINGLSWGLCLISYTQATADSLAAKAPSP